MARENMKEFISIYESEPCLWQTKCKEYYDKSRRDVAYSRLVENMQMIEPTAVKDTVSKKINNIRSVYRKEKKKLKDSMKKGSGCDVYKPKLWYFKLLRFLDDSETPRGRGCKANAYNIKNEDEHSDFAPQNSDNDEPPPPPPKIVQRTSKPPDSCEPTPCKCNSQTRTGVQAANDNLSKRVMLTVNKHFKRPFPAEDRFDIVGKSVAIKLRSLPKQQMLFAEKLINDVMFFADMNKLDFSTRLNTDIVDSHIFSGNQSSRSPSPQDETQSAQQVQQFQEVEYYPQSPASDSHDQDEEPASSFYINIVP